MPIGVVQQEGRRKGYLNRDWPTKPWSETQAAAQHLAKKSGLGQVVGASTLDGLEVCIARLTLLSDPDKCRMWNALAGSFVMTDVCVWRLPELETQQGRGFSMPAVFQSRAVHIGEYQLLVWSGFRSEDQVNIGVRWYNRYIH